MSQLTVGSMFMWTGYPPTPRGMLPNMSHSHGKAVLDDLAPLGRELRRAIPDVYKGFGELHHAAFADGALDTRTKELIALALGVSQQCDGCIASHSRGAVKAGATKQEAAEVLRRNLGEGSDFNHRQIALLKHALKHPFASYTVVGHQTSHGTSNQTAKNDLTDLEQRGLLLRGKVGKAFVYSPVADLAGKLGL